MSFSLYIHLPWCVKKCPYCDFNSHTLRTELPESDYIKALLADLQQEAALVEGRQLHSIFIGGGTPSLFSGAAIQQLLDGVRACFTLTDTTEITLEANPGTVEQQRFLDYRAAGVNRLSIGIQSFSSAALQRIGRIHNGDEALAAVETARTAGFDNVNLDLMYALPQQTLADAVADITQAIALSPSHLSHYQLTLEPNTLFHHQPPPLPSDELAWDMQQTCQAELAANGFIQYEVSAYAQPQRQCAHNRNYWQFGDYLGIGAGAHGKITHADGRVQRYSKQRHPQHYLQTATTAARFATQETVALKDLPFEFMLNLLRLNAGFTAAQFTQSTGLAWSVIEAIINQALADELLELSQQHYRTTARGQQYLNELLTRFMA